MSSMMKKVLMIDNYDSFTYNLVHYIEEIGPKVTIKRNDTINIKEIIKINPEIIFISPGPCTPKEAGISVELIKNLSGQIPIFGVCLGHQSIGYAYGAKIINAKKLYMEKPLISIIITMVFIKVYQTHLKQQGIIH